MYINELKVISAAVPCSSQAALAHPGASRHLLCPAHHPQDTQHHPFPQHWKEAGRSHTTDSPYHRVTAPTQSSQAHLSSVGASSPGRQISIVTQPSSPADPGVFLSMPQLNSKEQYPAGKETDLLLELIHHSSLGNISFVESPVDGWGLLWQRSQPERMEHSRHEQQPEHQHSLLCSN